MVAMAWMEARAIQPAQYQQNVSAYLGHNRDCIAKVYEGALCGKPSNSVMGSLRACETSGREYFRSMYLEGP